jgi:hypothetical protein
MNLSYRRIFSGWEGWLKLGSPEIEGGIFQPIFRLGFFRQLYKSRRIIINAFNPGGGFLDISRRVKPRNTSGSTEDYKNGQDGILESQPATGLSSFPAFPFGRGRFPSVKIRST